MNLAVSTLDVFSGVPTGAFSVSGSDHLDTPFDVFVTIGVPEPSSVAILGLAMGALIALRRRV